MRRSKAEQEAWLRQIVLDAAERDKAADEGDTLDFGMTVARAVYRETVDEIAARRSRKRAAK